MGHNNREETAVPREAKRGPLQYCVGGVPLTAQRGRGGAKGRLFYRVHLQQNPSHNSSWGPPCAFLLLWTVFCAALHDGDPQGQRVRSPPPHSDLLRSGLGCALLHVIPLLFHFWGNVVSGLLHFVVCSRGSQHLPARAPLNHWSRRSRDAGSFSDVSINKGAPVKTALIPFRRLLDTLYPPPVNSPLKIGGFTHCLLLPLLVPIFGSQSPHGGDHYVSCLRLNRESIGTPSDVLGRAVGAEPTRRASDG